MQRISAVRLHCRKKLLEAQEGYTEYANKKRTEKNISIGQRVFANTTKHCSGTRQKLDLPISGPFVVTGRKGKAWQLKEIATNISYSVHPDYIIPSAAKNPQNRKAPQTLIESESTDSSSGSSSDSETEEPVTANSAAPKHDLSNAHTPSPNTPEPVTRLASLPRACKRNPVLNT